MKRVVLIASTVVMWSSSLLAQRTLQVQGVLRGADGKAVADGSSYQMTFKLYDAPTGGSQRWSETHTNVTIADGVYNVELGGTTSLAGLAFDTPYYLGVVVGNDQEMTPRLPLSMVSAAVNGTDNKFPSSGNVGIGTASPQQKLEVNGNIQASGSMQANGNIQANGSMSASGGMTVSGGLNVTGAVSMFGNVHWYHLARGQSTTETAQTDGLLIVYVRKTSYKIDLLRNTLSIDAITNDGQCSLFPIPKDSSWTIRDIKADYAAEVIWGWLPLGK